MKTKISLIALGLGLMFTLACTKYPPSSDRLLEDLAVLTQYDTKVDFTSYKYYTVATSIKKITDKDTTDLTNGNAQTILGEISNQMKQRGYLRPRMVQKQISVSVLCISRTLTFTLIVITIGDIIILTILTILTIQRIILLTPPACC